MGWFKEGHKGRRLKSTLGDKEENGPDISPSAA